MYKEEVRRKIFDKFNGKCAYCGKDLDFNNFQVDHLVPVYYFRIIGKIEESDNFDNLVPTFSIINNYKRHLLLEDFRRRLIKLSLKLKKLPKNPRTQKSLKYKEYLLNISSLFGISESKPFDGLFYFEKTKIK